MEKLTLNRPDEWKGEIVFDINNHGHNFEEFLKNKCNVDNIKSFEINVNTYDFESDVKVKDNLGISRCAKINLIEFLNHFKEIKFNGSFK
jgi:hypothetical protein